MSELPKTYDPKAVEGDIYERWTKAGAFHAKPDDDGKPYCIVIPPPNVTAALHVGHALNNALQDILIRFRRMQGRNTLWMPGTDHASIATQTVVEKRLLAEEGKRRTDFERDEFVARVQDWKDEYEARILDQLKRMGCSCDWQRTRFTMDKVCARAVRSALFRLFADGLVYRGKRLVNWDPATQTVLADDEIEHQDVQGHFWYLQYPLVERTEIEGTQANHVTVATTRPETMLGDTAVAVNPADPRAAALVGKHVRLPIVGRVIPIVADEHVVLPDPDSDDEKARFSTGFLKVTPAHDPDDYAIGDRHLAEIAAARRAAGAESDRDEDLVFVNVMAPDGTISDRHGWSDCDTPEAQNLVGIDRFEAREAVVEFFRLEGLLEDVRDYTHPVGHSYRSHVPIEPYLSDQWYVAVKEKIADCRSPIDDWAGGHPDLVERRDGTAYLKGTDVPVSSLAGLALAPLLDGRLRFTPERYARTYQTWLENLRDWPISRQLWWGHRIPIWSRTFDLTPDNYVEKFLRAGMDNLLEENSWVDPKRVCFRVVHVDSGTVYDGITRDMLPITDETAGEYRVYACALDDEFDGPLHDCGFRQDEDVLDTWFSSGLWPFSTMGWPEETPELKAYYPGDVLCTAREIITLWVSRMVMLGQYYLSDIPFSDVFIHAMIQDGEGRKMSKSLGNGIDPLDIIDSHGADAMRFTLASMTTQTQDVRMPVEEMTLPDGRRTNTSPKFDLGRNFCNKLWNAARFALLNLEACPAWSEVRTAERLEDRWILSRLNTAVRDATRAIEAFRFNELADTVYHFMWDDFCDWYLEIAKSRINAGDAAPKAILAHALDVLLRLLHPVCPFITEEIWRHVNEVVAVRGPSDEPAEKLLVRAQWPHADAAAIQPTAEEEFAALQEIVRQIRNARTEHNVPPGEKVKLIVEATGRAADSVAGNADLLRSQAGLSDISVRPEPVEPPKGAAAVTAGGVKAYVLDIIDVEAERARLTKRAETLRKGIGGIEAKLSNEGFVQKAPAEVVQRERDRLADLQGELEAVEASLASLE